MYTLCCPFGYIARHRLIGAGIYLCLFRLAIFLDNLPKHRLVPNMRLLCHFRIGSRLRFVICDFISPRLYRLRCLRLKRYLSVITSGFFPVNIKINGSRIHTAFNINRHLRVVTEFKIFVVTGNCRIHRWFYITDYHRMRTSLDDFQFSL